MCEKSVFCMVFYEADQWHHRRSIAATNSQKNIFPSNMFVKIAFSGKFFHHFVVFCATCAEYRSSPP